MKFAHMADVHIGSWRDPKLKDLSIDSFVMALKRCEELGMDFILIAGDLFNTALPGIDNLKTVVKELKNLKEKNISVYIIPGSHDYSPSGKTMIDVLEEAGLAINVVKGTVKDSKLHLKFTVDKSGAKITGMLGRKGQLEKSYYENLDLEPLEKEKGFKIFMFHSAIAEMMPKEFASMDSTSLSSLPKDFDYYAGGHVHVVKPKNFEHYKNIIYPGPLFPANFQELEHLSSGGFYIYDDGKLIREELNIKNTFVISVDAHHKTPEEIESIINQKIEKKEFINTIVLIRITGTLKSGKATDIKFNELIHKIYSQGAFYVMKNTSKLSSEEFEEIRVDNDNIEDVEDTLIREHLGQIKVRGFTKEKELAITKDLMKVLESEKHEGEKVHEYENRIQKETDRLLDI